MGFLICIWAQQLHGRRMRTERLRMLRKPLNVRRIFARAPYNQLSNLCMSHRRRTVRRALIQQLAATHTEARLERVGRVV